MTKPYIVMIGPLFSGIQLIHQTTFLHNYFNHNRFYTFVSAS